MIDKLVMATNNANKLREAREILAPLGIEVISQKEAGADIEADEIGDSFEENAVIKALLASVKQCCLFSCLCC